MNDHEVCIIYANIVTMKGFKNGGDVIPEPGGVRVFYFCNKIIPESIVVGNLPEWSRFKGN